MTLIENEAVIVGLLLFFPAVAFWLTKKSKIAKMLSAPGLCYAFGIALSNLHIIPPDAPALDSVSTYAIYLALPMILLPVNIKRLRGWVKRGAKNALVSFAIACVTVFIISVVSGVLLASKADPEHGWKLTGMIIGTYTGGSMNLAAVGKALEVPAALFVAVNAADIVLGSLFLPIQIAIIPLLEKLGFKKLPEDVALGAYEDPEVIEKIKKEGYWYKKLWNFYDFTYIVAISGLLMAIAYLISGIGIWGMWKGAVKILTLTTLALIVANFPKVSELVGAEEVAMYLLHVFFVAIGATAYIPTLMEAGLSVILWVILAVYLSAAIHYFVVGKLLKIDYATMEVTAQAAVGGPSSALALALTANWPGLGITAILAGLLGYAVGNYLGVAGAYIVFKTLL